MASSQLVHLAEGQSMSAGSSVDGQVWHIAATLLYDHAPREVVKLLDAMAAAEGSGAHRAALVRVGQALRGWKA